MRKNIKYVETEQVCSINVWNLDYLFYNISCISFCICLRLISRQLVETFFAPCVIWSSSNPKGNFKMMTKLKKEK